MRDTIQIKVEIDASQLDEALSRAVQRVAELSEGAVSLRSVNQQKVDLLGGALLLAGTTTRAPAKISRRALFTLGWSR